MPQTDKILAGIKKNIKRLLRFGILLLLCVIVLLGGWCIPPKMVNRVMQGIKSKFNIEFVVEQHDKDRDKA